MYDTYFLVYSVNIITVDFSQTCTKLKDMQKDQSC